MGWKFRKTRPAEASATLDLAWESVVLCTSDLLKLWQEFHAHKERMDSKLAAIEKRLDKIEGIR